MDFPELPYDIKQINQQLIDYFGVDTVTGQAMWRVAWSNDQYEKRMCAYTPEGLQLLYPQVFTMPKYQWVKNRWILERLCIVPEINQNELIDDKISYEIIYFFENETTKQPIPPLFKACKFVVDAVYASMGKKSMRKYVDEEAKNPMEAQKERIDKLQEELFGDESSLLLRTVTGEAVAYTGEPKISPVKE
jgi:hypothetical protein